MESFSSVINYKLCRSPSPICNGHILNRDHPRLRSIELSIVHVLLHNKHLILNLRYLIYRTICSSTMQLIALLIISLSSLPIFASFRNSMKTSNGLAGQALPRTIFSQPGLLARAIISERSRSSTSLKMYLAESNEMPVSTIIDNFTDKSTAFPLVGVLVIAVIAYALTKSRQFDADPPHLTDDAVDTSGSSSPTRVVDEDRKIPVIELQNSKEDASSVGMSSPQQPINSTQTTPSAITTQPSADTCSIKEDNQYKQPSIEAEVKRQASLVEAAKQNAQKTVTDRQEVEAKAKATYLKRLEEQRRLQAVKLAEAKRKEEQENAPGNNSSEETSSDPSYSPSKPASDRQEVEAKAKAAYLKRLEEQKRLQAVKLAEAKRKAEQGRLPSIISAEETSSVPSYSSSKPASDRQEVEAKAKAAYLKRLEEQKRLQAVKLAEAKRKAEEGSI
jgi:hypothetical protein